MSFGHVENTAWLERIYISGSKSNQAMELGQLIDYKRNIFFQKLCRKWGRETSFRLLLCFSCYILLTDQILLPIAFTSRDIGQYVHYNCLLIRLWRHKIWD